MIFRKCLFLNVLLIAPQVLVSMGDKIPEELCAEMKKIVNLDADENEKCYIADLDKIALLEVLYEASFQPQEFSRVINTHQSKIREEYKSEFEKVLSEKGGNIDYVLGRPMKVDLSGAIVDVRLYNRDNGAGKAQKAIQQLRETNNKS